MSAGCTAEMSPDASDIEVQPHAEPACCFRPHEDHAIGGKGLQPSCTGTAGVDTVCELLIRRSFLKLQESNLGTSRQHFAKAHPWAKNGANGSALVARGRCVSVRRNRIVSLRWGRGAVVQTALVLFRRRRRNRQLHRCQHSSCRTGCSPTRKTSKAAA